ncbi:hypothetical protein [Pontibacter virosus]|uniref:Tissue inhibitor of metalloproteinase n=1 Tax=Pontibacter virosus TaxID=1765052 RepID=A0A2U1AI92_9BACT|nr:hypothetical protein [Pontibacter virosus]PVY36085.1 hypothetical protein C8E01_12810 [Pontibacter virosus]
MRKLVLLVCLSLFCHSTYSCECIPKRWEAGVVSDRIENTDLIFIGEVFSLDSGTYKIRVVDLFKGQVASDTLIGYNSYNDCYTMTVTKGLWIIYTGLDKHGRIPEVPACGVVLSRSLTEPENQFVIVPPPPSDKLDSIAVEAFYKAQEREQLLLHMKNWMNEYVLLTNYRNKVKEAEPTEKKNSDTLTYVALGLAIMSLLMVLLKK